MEFSTSSAVKLGIKYQIHAIKTIRVEVVLVVVVVVVIVIVGGEAFRWTFQPCFKSRADQII